MLGQQNILVTILLEQLAGIDEENTAIGLGTLLKYYDTGGYTNAKEEVGGQLDYGVNIVVRHKIMSYFLLIATTIQYAWKLYDSSCTLLRKMPEHVHGESQIGCTLWCQNTGRSIALIIDKNGVILALPLKRIRWI